VGGLGVLVGSLVVVVGSRRISRFRGSSGKSEVVLGSRGGVRGLEVVVGGLGEQGECLNRRNWLIFLLRSASTATWPPRT
jgi:hypothetical protein